MKAQLKMFETIAVLVVFFFLLAIGIVFYFWAQKSAMTKEKAGIEEQYSFQTALKTLHMPELDCSFLTTQRDNCADSIKAEKFGLLMKDENAIADYFNEFGYSTITITKVYPDDESWIVYNNTGNKKSRIKTQNPILIYEPEQDRYAFGIIEADVYV